MLRVEIHNDESLMEVLDSMISAMLPHENYEPKLFGSVLQGILKYIKLEEFTMEYHVLLSILHDLRRRQSVASHFSPYLTEQNLEIILNQNLFNIVQKDKIGLKEWNNANNHSNDLNNELVLEQSVQRLYGRIKDLHERCMDLKVPSVQGLSYMPALEEALIGNIAQSSISAQAMIMDIGLRLGRKLYVGARAWKDYMYDTAAELRKRFDSENSEVFTLDSVDQVNEIKGELKQLFMPIAKYDIPPLDASAPILKHWLVAVCANEGVGKTAFIINTLVKIVLQNEPVVFMCGETQRAGIFARIISHYILLTRNKYVTTEDLANLDDLEPDLRKLVDLCMLELAEKRDGGLISFVPAFNYYTLYEELSNLYDQNPFSGLFIDHSLALSGGKDMIQDVAALAVDLRNFKNDYPVYIGVTSHLSSLAKDLIARGKTVDTSPTKGNSNLSSEADEVFILFQNDKMKKQDLVANMVSKTRGQTKVLDLVMLKFKSAVSTFEYDPADQVGYDTATVEAEQMLERLAEQNEDDEDEYGWTLVGS